MNIFNNYISYTIEDLLNNDKFISLINQLNSDASLLKDWDDLIRENSNTALLEAATIIQLSAGKKVPPVLTVKEKSWANIATQISNKGKLYSLPWWRVAAIFILFTSIGIAAVKHWGKMSVDMKQQMASRQSRVVVLPDNSIVILGPNSTITYKENWNNEAIREVWLDGEAHFDVKHFNKDSTQIKQGEKFIVHIGEKMEIQVLGTIFNVKHQASKTIVELESGSVKIALKNKQHNAVWLRPGEKIELDTSTNLFTRSKYMDSYLASDTSQKNIELNNTSMVDIIKIIQTNFHKKVMVEDSTILTRTMDGILPMNKENEVLFIIESILNVKIEQTDAETITIRTK